MNLCNDYQKRDRRRKEKSEKLAGWDRWRGQAILETTWGWNLQVEECVHSVPFRRNYQSGNPHEWMALGGRSTATAPRRARLGIRIRNVANLRQRRWQRLFMAATGKLCRQPRTDNMITSDQQAITISIEENVNFSFHDYRKQSIDWRACKFQLPRPQ